MPTILVVDDEPGVRHAFRAILSERYKTLLADSGRKALEIMDSEEVDLVFLDLMMPGMSGLDLLAEMKRRGSAAAVVVVTAINSVSTAVDAMKRGAAEYIIKPFDVDQIQIIASKVLEETKMRQELEALREEKRGGFENIIGEAPALRAALRIAENAMAVDSTVLITGESGTGKDLLARAIHSGGKRAGHPFVHVSCCAIPAGLVESELFGHERGAFTGALEKQVGKIKIADKGTVFLDEIGEMPIEAQSKLLRVLQDGEFYAVGGTKSISADVRFICATNRDLQECIRNRQFREDLYYRINVIPIEMPPLRQRREDIPRLALHFVKKYAPQVNGKTTGFTREALAAMAVYSWPGNVRELENVVQRILVHHRDREVIEAEHLRGILPVSASESVRTFTGFDGLPLEEATRQLERRLIERALEQSGYVQSRAAAMLGTTRRILKYKMDQLELTAPNEETPNREAS